MKIGIDPGLDGAIALLCDDNTYLDVFDMPCMALSKTKRQVNAAEVANIFRQWGADYNLRQAVLEKVGAMPKQGVSSSFNFGHSYGIIKGVLHALLIPYVLITPQQWKKRAGLIGADKDMARTKAIQLYPQAPLSRKKDIGRADAILIARYAN